MILCILFDFESNLSIHLNSKDLQYKCLKISASFDVSNGVKKHTHSPKKAEPTELDSKTRYNARFKLHIDMYRVQKELRLRIHLFVCPRLSLVLGSSTLVLVSIFNSILFNFLSFECIFVLKPKTL